MKELTDITQIQAALFQLLVYFDDFCKANNLRYFLSNGTLLGAVKYGNFIPWDDDADVFMPRADFLFRGIVLFDVPHLCGNPVICQPLLRFLASGTPGIAYENHFIHL